MTPGLFVGIDESLDSSYYLCNPVVRDQYLSGVGDGAQLISRQFTTQHLCGRSNEMGLY